MSDPMAVKEFQGFVVDGEMKITHDNVLELRKAFVKALERLEYRTGVHYVDLPTEELTSSEKKEFEQLLLIYQQLVDYGWYDIDHLTEFSIGGIARFIGQADKAKQHYLRALRISKEYESNTLNSLGGLAEYMGEPDEAERLYRQCLAIDIEIKDNDGRSRALHNLALIAEKRGDLNEAEILYRDSISCYSDIENPHGKAISLKYLGELLRKKGDTYEAEIMHRKAIEIYNYYFMTYELTDSWISLGLIEESRADHGEAIKCYNMSLSYARDTENREAELLARKYLSNIGKNCGQFDKQNGC